MTKFIDYYKVLQVHPIAEPEVIEGAYKKLSKKYHPDVCQQSDAEEKMKLINAAYEILNNDDQKKIYDIAYKAYQEKPTFRSSAFLTAQQIRADAHQVAEKLLEDYFSCIAREAYDKAYFYISDLDKNQMRYADFANWQRAVAALYEIIDFNFSYSEMLNPRDPIMKKFTYVFDFDISISEIDKRTG